MVTKKSWQEFREAGLLWWINTTLHMFGWSIVFDFDDDNNLKEVYPARVKFRGFDNAQVTEGYQKVSKYLESNIEELTKETFE